ncbi:MAG: hypothetical protein OEZ10_07915 [Gammaproteobacteria bacterium]|nr:hypothetical protein [Gammaproteobacteria bacterium]
MTTISRPLLIRQTALFFLVLLEFLLILIDEDWLIFLLFIVFGSPVILFKVARSLRVRNIEWDTTLVSFLVSLFLLLFASGMSPALSVRDNLWELSPLMYAVTAGKNELNGYALGNYYPGNRQCLPLRNEILKLVRETYSNLKQSNMPDYKDVLVPDNGVGRLPHTCVDIPETNMMKLYGNGKLPNPFTALTIDEETGEIVAILVVAKNRVYGNSERDTWKKFANRHQLESLGYWDSNKLLESAWLGRKTGYQFFDDDRAMVAFTRAYGNPVSLPNRQALHSTHDANWIFSQPGVPLPGSQPGRSSYMAHYISVAWLWDPRALKKINDRSRATTN